ncbi:RNA polymerase subunit sigma-70 [Nonomuraea sp. 3-1Str]|uniref:RNA polymerase subunit sigma-70 n=1 Tax=Nonomuraea sp. 3-1Str TaxID=2929801 RepID=UPI002865D06D|nr:RNA polymerase subunit sigma-70 [Nonomuraea sp. 3-1Str]MDR8409718.1 RNA polymerase subunit sigma-70 [Nonomuraea sp. 3-1Str]
MAEIAFDELVAAHRHELLLHCYRLLGSLTDAEDLLQETLLAAWRGLDGFQGRASLRSWLYRIATNRCLNALRDRGRRSPPVPVPPFQPPEPSRLGDVPWLQPYPDTLLEHVPDAQPGPEARYTAREAVELAFVAALQRLPPRQAAVLVLCDVLGYPLGEVAPMLDATPNAVKGLLQRARTSLDRHRRDVRSHAPTPGSEQERHLVRRFAEAFTTDDIGTLVTLLTDDAWLAMPPAPHEYHGAAAIAAFLRAGAAWRAGRRLLLRPTRANGQPAFLCHFHGTTEQPAGIIVLTLTGDRLHGITRFLDDRLQRHHEAPPEP